MSDKPPFDVEKASFWLVAFVIGVYALVVTTSVGFCWFVAEEMLAGKWVCDKDSRLAELLGAALAAALAFAGRRNKEPPK